jgi:hypothetical protein
MTIGTLSVNAQSEATANSLSSATIIQHITLDNDGPLAFGSIIKDADGGTVTINPTTGAPTYSNLPDQLLTSTSAALFTVTGEIGYSFSLSLPANGAITLTSAAVGANPLVLNNFLATIPTTTNTLIPASGEVEFGVGATLVVGENQTPGLYNGNFDVTVAYE